MLMNTENIVEREAFKLDERWFVNVLTINGFQRLEPKRKMGKLRAQQSTLDMETPTSRVSGVGILTTHRRRHPGFFVMHGNEQQTRHQDRESVIPHEATITKVKKPSEHEKHVPRSLRHIIRFP